LIIFRNFLLIILINKKVSGIDKIMLIIAVRVKTENSSINLGLKPKISIK